MLTASSTRLISGILRESPANKLAAAARQMEPLRRNLSLAPADKGVTHNMDDGRCIQDRTLDVVVNRLLKELTW